MKDFTVLFLSMFGKLGMFALILFIVHVCEYESTEHAKTINVDGQYIKLINDSTKSYILIELDSTNTNLLDNYGRNKGN